MTLRGAAKRLLYWSWRRCGVCERHARFKKRSVIVEELAVDWNLNNRQVREFDEREGAHCAFCHSNRRSEQLAKTLTDLIAAKLGKKARSLKEAVRLPGVSAISLAEINSAGMLHPYLSQLPGLRYSEYGSSDPQVPSETLEKLTYADDTFDFVTTSDTLEHVPDIELALREIFRVLKPGGWNVFTVPILWDRTSLRRADLENGKLIHRHPPSFHGDYRLRRDDMVVFHEFGSDFPDMVKALGYELSLVRDPSNSAMVVFRARKPFR